jgi:hypothetical protein
VRDRYLDSTSSLGRAPAPLSDTLETGACVTDAVLYRDPDYGALALVQRPGGLIEVLDHGFRAQHFDNVLRVLERHGRPGAGDSWRLESHPAAVLASVDGALRGFGYTLDPLAAHAILHVDEATARRPDLPIDRRTSISESVSHWMEASLWPAWMVLGSSFALTGFVRPNARDLPFIRARAAVGRADESKIREKFLQPMFGSQLVRASLDGGVFEVAVAPTRNVLAEWARREPPKFTPMDLVTEREAVFMLGEPLDVQTATKIGERAQTCAAVRSFERIDEHTVVVKVPTSYSGGEAVTDPAFRERSAWLTLQLGPWSPELADVGLPERAAVVD